MTRKRNIGSVAAIGGATAMVALLTGLPGVRADELADLRANQQLLQQRIDQLAQAQAQYQPPAPLTGGSGGGQALTLGYRPAPTAPSLGGSFPRSFLIPGTDTSIRVGGFVDITGLYYLQGNNSSNPGTPSSNSGQNGNLVSIPVGEGFIPGAPNGGVVAQSANHSRSNGVYTTSPQQSRLDIETRTPTAWGESRTFFSFDWAGGNGFSALSVQQAGGDSLIPRLRFAYGTLGGFLRPGPLQLLGCRRRHRIDGVRRHDGLDRRQSHPAGALYPCRSVWQRLFGVGRTTGHRHHRAERHHLQRPSPGFQHQRG